jgi:hypothetical protein
MEGYFLHTGSNNLISDIYCTPAVDVVYLRLVTVDLIVTLVTFPSHLL